MTSFRLENPNRHLIVYGLSLIIIVLAAVLLKNYRIIVVLGMIARILALLWIPRAADMMGRNRIGWTIASFICPSVSIIILGYIGYKQTPLYNDTLLACQEEYSKKRIELEELLSNGEINNDEMQRTLFKLHTSLSVKASEAISHKYGKPDEKFLNSLLESKGYVIDDKKDVFVEFNDKCPACGSELKESDKECPSCGLNVS